MIHNLAIFNVGEVWFGDKIKKLFGFVGYEQFYMKEARVFGEKPIIYIQKYYQYYLTKNVYVIDLFSKLKLQCFLTTHVKIETRRNFTFFRISQE